MKMAEQQGITAGSGQLNVNPPGGANAPVTIKPQAYAFTAEFGDKQNRNFMWPPDKREIRGWFKKDNLGGVTMDENFAGIPSLPGLRLTIDTRKKYISITDPLAESRFKDVAEKASTTIQNSMGARQGPEDPFEIKNASPDVLKNWCYWARRFLDAKQLKKLTGEIPTMDQINGMPGEMETSQWDSNPLVANKKRTKQDNYRPMVHIEAKGNVAAMQDLLEGEGDDDE